MKFFTTDLYLRSNSRDDAVADRAADDWEKASPITISTWQNTRSR